MPSLESESKGDTKDNDDDDKQAINTTLEKGELLMYVASDAHTKLYGKNGVLTDFVNRYSMDWESAVEGERDGSGSPIKMMGKYKSYHDDYLELMESALDEVVRKNGGTLDRFMLDVNDALAGGAGFLFEDDNYSEFVEAVQSMTDFEIFHQMMIKECKKSMGGSYK